MSFGLGAGLTPWVQRLIIANVVIWILQLTVPGLTGILEFVPRFVLFRPWTPFTYMFAHDPSGFSHIFFNMLSLYFFGPPVEGRFGSSEFIKYYIICGLGGAALSFLFPNAAIIGASGAIFGIMLAFAMNWPDAPIYIYFMIPVPAKLLIAGMVVFSLFSGITGHNAGVAHFAHLGGFAAGWLYLKFGWRSRGMFSGVKKSMNKRRMNVVQGGASAGPPGPQDVHILSELDRVLDKISKQGMSSLSPEERRLLDEASRRYRQN